MSKSNKSKMRALITSSGHSMQHIADHLNITRATLYNRISNPKTFSYSDIILLKRDFKINFEPFL